MLEPLSDRARLLLDFRLAGFFLGVGDKEVRDRLEALKQDLELCRGRLVLDRLLTELLEEFIQTTRDVLDTVKGVRFAALQQGREPRAGLLDLE